MRGRQACPSSRVWCSQPETEKPIRRAPDNLSPSDRWRKSRYHKWLPPELPCWTESPGDVLDSVGEYLHSHAFQQSAYIASATRVPAVKKRKTGTWRVYIVICRFLFHYDFLFLIRQLGNDPQSGTVFGLIAQRVDLGVDFFLGSAL